jgi:hypothetical protein
MLSHSRRGSRVAQPDSETLVLAKLADGCSVEMRRVWRDGLDEYDINALNGKVYGLLVEFDGDALGDRAEAERRGIVQVDHVDEELVLAGRLIGGISPAAGSSRGGKAADID